MFALWFDSIRVFFQQLAESQQATPIALHIENNKAHKPTSQRR